MVVNPATHGITLTKPALVRIMEIYRHVRQGIAVLMKHVRINIIKLTAAKRVMNGTQATKPVLALKKEHFRLVRSGTNAKKKSVQENSLITVVIRQTALFSTAL